MWTAPNEFLNFIQLEIVVHHSQFTKFGVLLLDCNQESRESFHKSEKGMYLGHTISELETFGIWERPLTGHSLVTRQ